MSKGRETFTRNEYKQLLVSDKDVLYNFDQSSFASFIRYISVVVLRGYNGLTLKDYPEKNLETIDLLKSDALESFITAKVKYQDTFFYGNGHSQILITYKYGMPYMKVEHYSGRREIFERLVDHTVWGVFEVEKE